jgi:hypothetical protein
MARALKKRRKTAKPISKKRRKIVQPVSKKRGKTMKAPKPATKSEAVPLTHESADFLQEPAAVDRNGEPSAAKKPAEKKQSSKIRPLKRS